MKKLFATTLALAVMATAGTTWAQAGRHRSYQKSTATATQSTSYTCPRGYEDCNANGACLYDCGSNGGGGCCRR